MVGGDDLRHDVAAKGGTDLNQIGVLLHLQHGAVGGKTRVASCGNAGCQLATQIGGTYQNPRGLVLLNEIIERRGVGLHTEILQRGIIVNEYLIHAVAQQLIGKLLHVGANEQGVDRVVDNGGKLSCLSDQLVGHTVKLFSVVIGVYAESAPKGFVKLFSGGLFLYKFHHACGSLADAHLAHLAGRGDLQLAVGVGEGAKGAKLFQGGGVLCRDQILIDL